MYNKKQDIYVTQNSLLLVLRFIIHFAFFPKTMTKTSIRKDIRNREILFTLFLIESINLFAMFSNNNVFGEKTLILSIAFATIGIYFLAIIYALVLYVLDKSLIKKLYNYKVCLKLALLFVIVDVFGGILYSIIGLIGLELGTILSYVFDLLTFIYAITTFTYYLIKIYECKTLRAIFVDIVYIIIFIAPKVLNYFLF